MGFCFKIVTTDFSGYFSGFSIPLEEPLSIRVLAVNHRIRLLLIRRSLVRAQVEEPL